jgi:hypothetical protein
MKKVFMIFALATGFVANGFGQQNVGLNLTNVAPLTSPASISQLEVRGRLITQNAFLGFTPIPLAQQTGSFGTAARWNSMGSLNAGSQVLNGFRTQTNGKGLTLGYSVPNPGQPNAGIVSNPTIQWIGNAAVGSTPGILDFKYANSPGSPGFPQQDVTMFSMSPQGASFLPFSYATKGALIGQLENGQLGNFTQNNIWSATGSVNTANFISYGARHQYNGYTLNSGLLTNLSNQTSAVIDFGNNSPAGVGSFLFKFRSFRDPVDLNSVKNIWQSSTKFNNIVLGRDEYFNYNNSQFYLSLFDGKAAQTGLVAQTFIDRAGIYATCAGFDDDGNPLNNYAAVVGDVSLAANNGFAHIGILGISDDDVNNGGNKWAGYFIGSTFTTGSAIVGSDRKLKKEVKDEQNMMAKLMQLKPKNYFFDTKKYPNAGFSSKLQHGLISQELEEVFPELVQEVSGPIGAKGKAEQLKGVNYNGLITMLLQGIQEQQVQIDGLKGQLSYSKTLVINDKLNLPADIENKAFALSQNTPNPFSERTTISYTIPTNVQKATLAVFDLTGKMLLQYNLLQGKNTVQIDGNTLAAGMYLYTLLADGQEVLSKRMVLTK